MILLLMLCSGSIFLRPLLKAGRGGGVLPVPGVVGLFGGNGAANYLLIYG